MDFWCTCLIGVTDNKVRLELLFNNNNNNNKTNSGLREYFSFFNFVKLANLGHGILLYNYHSFAGWNVLVK